MVGWIRTILFVSIVFTFTSTLMLAHWNNSPQGRHAFQQDTLSRRWANHTLLSLLDTVGVVIYYPRQNDRTPSNLTKEKSKLISIKTDKISQQSENCENRNDPDLVQAFLTLWYTCWDINVGMDVYWKVYYRNCIFVAAQKYDMATMARHFHHINIKSVSYIIPIYYCICIDRTCMLFFYNWR
jgi:hypothetical protein